jgi:hypothetical protein
MPLNGEKPTKSLEFYRIYVEKTSRRAGEALFRTTKMQSA